MKELDFRIEVSNAEKIRKLMKNHKNLKIPFNFLELCNRKIIVMEFCQGLPIMDVQELKRQRFNLTQVSKKISKAFNQMIF